VLFFAQSSVVSTVHYRGVMSFCWFFRGELCVAATGLNLDKVQKKRIIRIKITICSVTVYVALQVYAFVTAQSSIQLRLDFIPSSLHNISERSLYVEQNRDKSKQLVIASENS